MRFRFFVNNAVVFQCNLNCGQCTGTTTAGTRCKRRVCIGTPFCFSHITPALQLKVAPSTIPNAGKGVFAFNKTKGANEIIFRKNDIICSYGGEFISKNELEERYGEYTAPYGIEVNRNLVQDGACTRSAGSLFNHKNRRTDNNAEFYLSTQNIGPHPRQIKIRATRPIRNNQEIFVHYGNDYVMNEEDTNYTTK